MDKRKIQELLITAIERVQRASGEAAVGIGASTCPIRDLPGFDSQRGIEATVVLETLLGLEIPGEANIFVAPNGQRALRITEIVERTYDLIKLKEAEH
jgi:hypothetical protein